MTIILDRLAKIIAMTDSSDVEEARTAAWAAVQLIKKHKIQFRMPSANGSPIGNDDISEYFSSIFDVKPTSTSRNNWASMRDEAMENIRTQQAAQRSKPPAPPPTAAKPKDPPAAPTKPKRKPVFMQSKYGGVCLQCRGRFVAGDDISYVKGAGVTHYECRSYWDNDE